MVSEQPMSASEDRRILRQLTGLALVDGGLADEEKAEEPHRRDTGVTGLGPDGGSNGSDIAVRTQTSTSPDLSTDVSTAGL